MLKKFYRFYLSFENSLFPDYVTERLYRALSRDTIPIVLGGSDYLSYLPAGSYVDILDFDHPQNLAKYLLQLMTNDILYLNHFWLKRQYFIDPVPIDGWFPLCKFEQNLCNKHKTYEYMAMWRSGKMTNKSACPYQNPCIQKNK
jgi:alpha-1,3-fucosyltransferase